MTSPNFSIVYSAVVSGTASNGSPGDVLIPDATSGEYVLATAAARGSRRSTGLALASYVAGGVVSLQQSGVASAVLSGLGAGTASYVRVSAAGSLERVASPTSADDVVGWCETDGVFHARFGQPPGGYGTGGGGGGGASLPIVLTTDVSGILPAANGGTGSASLPAGGLAGLTGLAAGDAASVATAAADATTKANAAVVTAATATATAISNERSAARVLSNASISGSANTLSAIAPGSLTPSVSNGEVLTTVGGVAAWAAPSGGGGVPTGTGFYTVTAGVMDAAAKAVAAGVYTFLATPSSANLLAMLTDETGTGDCVFGTAPLFKTTINLNNPGNTFKYVITPAAIAADRILNLPLMTGTDTVALLALAQTFTNKTLTSPVINTPSFGSNALTTTGVVSGACFKASGVVNNGTTTSQTVTGTALGQVRMTGGTSIIAGILDAAVLQGRVITLYALAGAMTVNHEDATATASNRILTPTMRALVVQMGGSATFFYDGTLSRWTVIAVSGPDLGNGVTDNATAGGTVNNCTLGNKRRIRFTNASGPTVTGFDATGVVDGEELEVYAAVGVVAITHEDALSTAGNRVTLQGGTTINVPIGCFTIFRYMSDGANSRWRHCGATAI